MEVSQVSKMLAYSFVSELINKKKVKSNGRLVASDEVSEEAFDISEMSFGDLETYYKNVLTIIEDTPEIRSSLVDSIKRAQEDGEDLNLRYPAKLIAQEESLQKQLFM
ncbi:MAG: hypothetical protein HOA17_04580 [Candidatus Melainabacteria bacterium]|jgi:hypothetical protein|nr:hypothetical protein [Candidatus Melainabacteria bacterium]